jgi:signal transduction histidine kinase
MEMGNSGLISRPPSSSLPLERKLPLLILGVLAFVLALSLVISYYAIRRAALLSSGERLASLSHVLGPMVQQPILNRLPLMARVASDTAVVNALRTPGRPLSESAANALQPLMTRADSLTPAQIWTPDGRAVGGGAIRLELPAEAQRARDDMLAQAANRDSAYVGKLHVTNGRASFWEAMPVRDNGNLLGYVVQQRRLGLNPRALQPFRDLIGSDIDLYVHNTGDPTWVHVGGQSVTVASGATAYGDTLAFIDLEARGQSLTSTMAIGGTPFALTVARPTSAILQRPHATMRVLIVIAILLSVLGGAIAWGISRQLVRPLVELTEAAEGFAHGEYSKRVHADGDDEIGRLGASFNRMAEKVQAASDRSTEALDQLTKSVATQQFLSDASRILSMSLSDQMLLADLARFCVPSIADYCSLHMVDDDGTLRRVETAHYNPAKQDALRALVNRYPYRLDGLGQVPAVIRSQQPLIMPRLDLAAIKAEAPDEETRKLLDEIGPRAFMCVPLIARGRPLGAISLTMADSGRTFTPADLDLAMELARRTAVAIDNALIYRRSLALRLEAEAASTAKSDFLAKMSHEIRTPINAMMGYAELLEMGISGPVSPAQARQLARIRASGEHLTSLVSEILDLAKIEAGRMGVEPTNGIAADAIEGALALIRPQAATKGIELSGRIEGDANIEYAGDPQRVQQILANLLSNAVKFTPAGGRISVTCGLGKRHGVGEATHDKDWACVTVEDTGIGIAPDDLERVFHAFVQVDGGYTRSQGGTGLGLTISRGLAQMMGGEITVESAVGQGSRFMLWLPVAQFVHS